MLGHTSTLQADFPYETMKLESKPELTSDRFLCTMC